jgi:hypothetical protein
MVEIFSSLPPVICPQHLDYMSSVVDVLLETGSGMKNRNFTKKYKDRQTINTNNSVKFEVNWPRSS